jgi:hypothetical protein
LFRQIDSISLVLFILKDRKKILKIVGGFWFLVLLVTRITRVCFNCIPLHNMTLDKSIFSAQNKTKTFNNW